MKMWRHLIVVLVTLTPWGAGCDRQPPARGVGLAHAGVDTGVAVDGDAFMLVVVGPQRPVAAAQGAVAGRDRSRVAYLTGRPSPAEADTPQHAVLDVFRSLVDGNGPRTGNLQFNKPTGLAISQNRLYVADSLNERIQVFRLN